MRSSNRLHFSLVSAVSLLLLLLDAVDSFGGPVYNSRHGGLAFRRICLTEDFSSANHASKRIVARFARGLNEVANITVKGWTNVTNGEGCNATALLPIDESLPNSPPLTFKKFLTMQEKRVPVTIRYSGLSGLRPFFLTVAKKIKDSNPDVYVDKLILPGVEDEAGSTFEVLVDGKVVVGKGRLKKLSVRRSSSGVGSDTDFAGGLTVFVPMEEIDLAIAKSRRRRRPTTTVYAQNETESDGERALRLQTLRLSSAGRQTDGAWND